ncbi:hypothetical protein XBLMG947_2084 [Xanthomonas bromi]|uniref:Uncharacterized protein n=1 Tax=Xanthomonas bromi TaxID=56449 RepID=A0A1C3NLN8_9XANT|nr:hypothetical protein XBLMG947_2084 [Xanthomonas bromi]
MRVDARASLTPCLSSAACLVRSRWCGRSRSDDTILVSSKPAASLRAWIALQTASDWWTSQKIFAPYRRLNKSVDRCARRGFPSSPIRTPLRAWRHLPSTPDPRCGLAGTLLALEDTDALSEASTPLSAATSGAQKPVLPSPPTAPCSRGHPSPALRTRHRSLRAPRAFAHDHHSSAGTALSQRVDPSGRLGRTIRFLYRLVTNAGLRGCSGHFYETDL